MKIIKYKICTKANLGTEDNPKIEEKFSDVTMPWSEANEEIAKKEAYNGEYEIVDDGQPEPEAQATTDDVLNALLGVTV